MTVFLFNLLFKILWKFDILVILSLIDIQVYASHMGIIDFNSDLLIIDLKSLCFLMNGTMNQNHILYPYELKN